MWLSAYHCRKQSGLDGGRDGGPCARSNRGELLAIATGGIHIISMPLTMDRPALHSRYLRKAVLQEISALPYIRYQSLTPIEHMMVSLLANLLTLVGCLVGSVVGLLLGACVATCSERNSPPPKSKLSRGGGAGSGNQRTLHRRHIQKDAEDTDTYTSLRISLIQFYIIQKEGRGIQ